MSSSEHEARALSGLLCRPWVGVAMYAALIFAISSIPAESMPDGRFWDFDKLIHAAEFGVLSVLVWRALPRVGRFRPLWAAALSSMYGVCDEVHQALVPGRDASGYDMLADSIGSVVAMVVLWLVVTRRDRTLG